MVFGFCVYLEAIHDAAFSSSSSGNAALDVGDWPVGAAISGSGFRLRQSRD